MDDFSFVTASEMTSVSAAATQSAAPYSMSSQSLSLSQPHQSSTSYAVASVQHTSTVADSSIPPPYSAVFSSASTAPIAPLLPSSSSSSSASSAVAPNSIIVSARQRGNPLLTHIRNCLYTFSAVPISADYVFGGTTCALFLSMSYHMLHPTYINSRIASVGKHYACRVLIALLDSDNSDTPLMAVTKIAFVNGWTLLCAWSNEEAARYCETLKVYENKSAADLIAVSNADETDERTRITELLTMIKSVNRTDVSTLMTEFGTLAKLSKATPKQLLSVAGFGEKKVSRLHTVMHAPFVSSRAPTYAAAATATTVTRTTTT